MVVEASLSVCDPGSPGAFLFGGYKIEHETKKKVRALVYLSGLLYMFMGVNIAADYFMSAVEHITTRRKRRRSPEGVIRTWKVWNDTFANLTLLALGSSAPEIMLSCIEIGSNNFHSGALGPGTIVGSAAFNLLVIIPVCNLSIPDGEYRAIKQVAVYHVTVIFSLIAYFWLLLIVVVISPDIIELWEAIVTLLFFVLLCIISFAADKGHLQWLAFDRRVEEPKDSEIDDEASPLAIADMAPGDAAAGPPLRASKPQEEEQRAGGSQRHSGTVHPRVRKASVSLHQDKIVANVRESLRNAKDIDTVTAGDAGQTHERGQPVGAKEDGKVYDGDEVIRNKNGVVTFWRDAVDVQVSNKGIVYEVEILRRNGAQGKVSCKAKTFALSATPEYSFTEIDGELIEFDDGETSKTLEVLIKPARRLQKNVSFQLCLEELTGGAEFNPNQDGCDGEAYLTFNLINTSTSTRSENPMEWLVERILGYDSLMFGFDYWKDQILEAFDVEGDDGDDEAQPTSVAGYIMHVITLPWKLFFALGCPPPHWLGGWLLFGFALIYIGAFTTLISDFASLFGCTAGMSDEITAISIVALGTSLPDMFASMTAAKDDPEADASIVNVTGSNSVNVFLGIGLPWTCAAIYWAQTGPTAEWQAKYPTVASRYPEGGFVVFGGNLGFSVNIFVSVAIIALVILRGRRLRCAGELGGPRRSKILCSIGLFCLWFTYLSGSILKTLTGDGQVFGIMINVASALSLVAAGVVEYMGPAKWEDLWPAEVGDEHGDMKATGVSDQVVFLSAAGPVSKTGQALSTPPTQAVSSENARKGKDTGSCAEIGSPASSHALVTSAVTANTSSTVAEDDEAQAVRTPTLTKSKTRKDKLHSADSSESKKVPKKPKISKTAEDEPPKKKKMERTKTDIVK